MHRKAARVLCLNSLVTDPVAQQSVFRLRVLLTYEKAKTHKPDNLKTDKEHSHSKSLQNITYAVLHDKLVQT